MMLNLSWAGKVTAALIGLTAFSAASSALAECAKPYVMNTPRIVPAAWSLAQSEAPGVTLTYIGHSSFVIESPAGVKIITDYNDFVRAPITPDIVTMNIAHSSHYSQRPQPGIKFVLPGWGTPDKPANHNLQYMDVYVRNVSTNIRDFFGNETMVNGNSIFVYELGDLCIAHLGHLHHRLTNNQLAILGQIDVVLVPIDGNLTLGQQLMLEVLDQIHAPLIIPMHAQNPSNLQRFIALMIADPKMNYTVKRSQTRQVKLSRDMLPAKPEFLILPGF
jgi:L-ascorbate metabolism protein UlaG (beta-lactamase superfamily)